MSDESGTEPTTEPTATVGVSYEKKVSDRDYGHEAVATSVVIETVPLGRIHMAQRRLLDQARAAVLESLAQSRATTIQNAVYTPKATEAGDLEDLPF